MSTEWDDPLFWKYSHRFSELSSPLRTPQLKLRSIWGPIVLWQQSTPAERVNKEKLRFEWLHLAPPENWWIFSFLFMAKALWPDCLDPALSYH